MARSNSSMTNLLRLAVLIFAQSVSAQSGPGPIPADVARFVSERNLCDHFRGEEPFNETRAQFLGDSIKEICTGTDQKLRSLKATYENDEGIMSMLNEFEETIE